MEIQNNKLVRAAWGKKKACLQYNLLLVLCLSSYCRLGLTGTGYK